MITVDVGLFLLKSSFSRSENPLLESRGEHIFVHTGMQAYIKISRSFYSALDREEDPCVDAEEHYGESSYGEVRRETGTATFFVATIVRIWESSFLAPS